VVNLAAGYFNGIHPPLRNFAAPGGIDKAEKAARNMVLAHARAFEAIHAADPTAQVGIAFNMAFFQAATADDPAVQAQHDAATKRLRYISNTALQQAVTHGDLDYDLDESLDGPNDRKADPTLADHIDWMGLNYYSIVQVSALGKSSTPPRRRRRNPGW
jgi:beta-glucosidase